MYRTKKSLYIPTNYFSYDHINNITQIAKPLFTHSPICYFDYTRMYFDGSWSFFASGKGINEYLCDEGFTFVPNINITKQHTFTLLSSTPAFTPYLAQIKQHFNLDNLFSYIKKEDKFIDIYLFGADKNNLDTVDFYFNNLDLIRQYTRYFHHTASDLVALADTNRIDIPKRLKKTYHQAFEKAQLARNDDSYQSSYFSSSDHSIILNEEKIAFTSRELSCIKLLLKGFTAKMIAKNFALSPRTIEQYLEKIKVKLHCHSREQLIYKLLEISECN